MSDDARIRITQVRSLIGAPHRQRRTLRSLGLRRVRHTVTQPDRPEIRGMIARVAHLVAVRYPGDDEALAIEPGQEPKGAGRPPAGASVAEEEAAALREAREEALAEPGRAAPGDLTEHPASLRSVDDPDRPTSSPRPQAPVPEDARGPKDEDHTP